MGLAAKVDARVVGVAAAAHDVDHGLGDVDDPLLMSGNEVVNGALVAVLAGDAAAQMGNGILQRAYGELVWLEENFVGGILIASNAGFFVSDKSDNEIGVGDVLIGNLDALNGLFSVSNLPN